VEQRKQPRILGGSASEESWKRRFAGGGSRGVDPCEEVEQRKKPRFAGRGFNRWTG